MESNENLKFVTTGDNNETMLNESFVVTDASYKTEKEIKPIFRRAIRLALGAPIVVENIIYIFILSRCLKLCSRSGSHR